MMEVCAESIYCTTWTENWNSPAREPDQENTKRQEEREKKMKLFLKLSSGRSQLATYMKLVSYLDTYLQSVNNFASTKSIYKDKNNNKIKKKLVICF